MTSPQLDQKSANESYFASLGYANASRPADLPPSQGGKYQGFGNTPSSDSVADHPSYGLSSRAAPTLNDIQENPVAALSKGWSIFSAAVSGATRAVSENVIQPGMERVMDPSVQANVRGYISDAGKRAGDLGKSANQWGKSRFGVDVADQVGGVVETVKDKIGGGPARDGYGAVPFEHDGETSALYHDEDDDFFNDHTHGHEIAHQQATSQPTPQISTGKKDEWNEWKDF
jgi:ADP-ribosylation factor GTPase-activating protein 1